MLLIYLDKVVNDKCYPTFCYKHTKNLLSVPYK